MPHGRRHCYAGGACRLVEIWGAAYGGTRIAYWVVNGVLRRVPAAVLRSRAASSLAWRESAKAYAKGLGRAAGQVLGGGLLAAGAGRVTKRMYVDKRGNLNRRRFPVTPEYAPGPRSIPVGAPRGARGSSSGSRKVYTASKVRTSSKFRTKARRPSYGLQARLQTPTVIERLQGVRKEDHNADPDTFTPGWVPMGFDNTVAGVDQYPIAIMALTSANNNNFGYVNSAKLTIDTSGVVSWNYGTGAPISQNFDGTFVTGGRFTLERQLAGGVTNGNTQPYKATHIQIPWFDIRLQLWGCKKQCVTWDISLVRFKEEWMCPETDAVKSGDETFTYRTFGSRLPGRLRCLRLFRVLLIRSATCRC